MRLYRNQNDPNRWYAHSQATGWVMFPAEMNGWTKRQPARGIDPLYFREMSLQLALDTGISELPNEIDGELREAA